MAVVVLRYDMQCTHCVVTYVRNATATRCKNIFKPKDCMYNALVTRGMLTFCVTMHLGLNGSSFVMQPHNTTKHEISNESYDAQQMLCNIFIFI